jgi:hypothetical protein
MQIRGLPRPEAERVAFEIVLVEHLNATHPDTPPGRCAHCSRAETPDAPLLPIGCARHTWLHGGCWTAWRALRRARAEDDLARLGVTRPAP